MKRFLACILVVILMFGTVAADAASLSGGWSVNTTASALKLNKQARQALTKATEKYTGMELTLLAVLGKQVVAGTNYCFLCYGKTTAQNPDTKLCMVYVYQDLKKNAEITKIKTLKMKHKPSGGWQLSRTSGKLSVESKAKSALKKAIAGLTGAEYKPLAVLGRAKSDNAFCLLCRSRLSDKGGTVGLALVYVSKSGKTYKVSGIDSLKIAK